MNIKVTWSLGIDEAIVHVSDDVLMAIKVARDHVLETGGIIAAVDPDPEGLAEWQVYGDGSVSLVDTSIAPYASDNVEGLTFPDTRITYHKIERGMWG